jgi:solute:Na+ symporter, SSS family
MSLSPLDWIIITSFFTISLAIGLYYRNRASKSISDFFLGGRNLPWYVAGISMVATTFAADTPLAVTELVGVNGISGNWLWWNMLFGGMLTTFFFARLWRRAEIITEAEFIELRYSGKEAAFLRGFKAIYLGFFINCLIIGWVNLALSSILQVFFDIPSGEALWYVGLAMLVAAIYSSLSGLWGVAVTDMVQFGIAMAGSIVLAVVVVGSDEIGGIDGMKAQLPEWTLNFFPSFSGGAGDTAKALTISIGAFLAYLSIWWASWYPGAEPGGGGYIAQRMMSAKNEKHSIYATLFFQIAHYSLRPWPWIIVGLCAIILYPQLGAEEKRLGYVMAMRDYLPAGLKGLLLTAFFAAYMSTISTQLNWGASYLVNDVYKRFIAPSGYEDEEKAQRKYVMVSRITTLLLMLIALFITSFITTISGVWSFIIECGAGLGLVLILRWYWWRINAWSEIAATIAPFVFYALSRFVLKVDFPDSFFITAGGTTITWLVVTFLTKPTDYIHLAKFYNKVRPEGSWKPYILDNGTIQGSGRIINLLVCWISAVVMTYSFLFFTGKFIFKEWGQALIWALSALLSFFILRHFVMRTKILE